LPRVGFTRGEGNCEDDATVSVVRAYCGSEGTGNRAVSFERQYRWYGLGKTPIHRRDRHLTFQTLGHASEVASSDRRICCGGADYADQAETNTSTLRCATRLAVEMRPTSWSGP